MAVTRIIFQASLLALSILASDAETISRKSHSIISSLERLSASKHQEVARHVSQSLSLDKITKGTDQLSDESILGNKDVESLPRIGRSSGSLSINSLSEQGVPVNKNTQTQSLLRRSSSEDIYLGICSEEEYEEWYLNKYPMECQASFTNASTLNELFQIYCDPFCGELYFDYLDECGNAGVILTAFYTNLCTENDKGVACYHYITSDDYPNSKPTVDDYCFPVNSTCTAECYHALDSLSINLGCCVNTLYNQTIPHPAADYELWTDCRLSTPGYCNRRSVSSSSGLASSLNLCSVAVVMFMAAILKQN